MPLSNFFVPKHRKVNFEVSIIIRDLTNVPLVSGFYHVRWRMRQATHTSGFTEKTPIKDHCTYWNHTINTMAMLVIDKQSLLGPCELKLEVYQELGSGQESVMIGSLTLNLAEYATSGLTTRRYLLHDCKFNSTIKLSIQLTQKTDVETQFKTPPLRKQQLFTDIPSMISDRKDRKDRIDRMDRMDRDEQSLVSLHSNPSSLSPLKKSHSAMSLSHYCKQSMPLSFSEDPSPTDLVEQLFMGKQPDMTFSSHCS
ncbi:N-terminal C2 in EEIG1 and EHBP1 proteins-domain-containing protein [Spinellus fusiger]|nr:N-terminal C2 in EEIG1 and EHBP1 proteins-domain-containing protein [Spinellus fusiger]